MRTDDLDYDLDPALIAREPASPRDAARMLVYDRRTRSVEHATVADLRRHLRAGDALVVNDTTVAPMRVKARRVGGAPRQGERPSPGGAVDAASDASLGALVEGLLLERRGPREWFALLRNTKRLEAGEALRLIGPGEVDRAVALDDGGPLLRFLGRDGEGSLVRIEGGAAPETVLAERGWTPLPPYILKARRDAGDVDDGHEDRDDRRRYQTVFAAPTEAPSVAAPTAGLHFTEALLADLERLGVERIPVSLQVGAGTFKPVETERLEDHPMHREHCVLSPSALARLRAARERSLAGRGRIIAVGTTSVRTLESMPSEGLDRASPSAASGMPLAWDTDILIAPGHAFRAVDGLLTNFHLPRSTLLALVAALIGLDEVRRLYAIATRERYRFYSYGDAMLLV